MRTIRTAVAASIVGAAAIAGATVLAGPSTASAAPVTTIAQVADTAITSPADQGAVRGWVSHLTADQRSCLQQQNLTRPVGPQTLAQRQSVLKALVSAADTCGVTVPPRVSFWAAVTPAQYSCFQQAGLTRPLLGTMTPEQRQQLRDQVKATASSCGMTLPAPKHTGAPNRTAPRPAAPTPAPAS